MQNNRQLRDRITLPSGLVFKNRLLKVGNNKKQRSAIMSLKSIGSDGRDHVKVSRPNRYPHGSL